jgi:hypothetical protein
VLLQEVCGHDPSVPYWHVWTDENGVSRQDRCELSDFRFESISNGAESSWIDRLSSSGTHMIVMVLPVGWVGEWHENPKPQWMMPISEPLVRGDHGRHASRDGTG